MEVLKANTTVLNLSLIVFLILTSPALGSVGEVSFQSRQAQITRDADKILTEVGTEVFMGDKVETLKGKITIIFVDETKVSISEYSKLVIDEFVYDAGSKKGKVNLKAGLGTLRYTSGLIAKNDNKNIKITTPTASVSVRGTDFEVAVKETGASTFTLLPSINADGSTFIGSIDVSNATGTVTLTKPFQVTKVVSAITPPTAPKVDTVREQKANEQKEEVKEDEEVDEQEVDEEEVDIENEKEFTEEDILNALQSEDSSSIFIEVDGKAVFESDNENKIKLIVDKTSNVTLKYDNKGVVTEGNLNNGGNVTINIIQQ